MSSVEVRVPDLGDFENVDVVEVHVKAGDKLAAEDPLITLETDKATMDVPAPQPGTVESVAVSVGSKVSTGDLIVTLAAEEEAAKSKPGGDGAAGAEAGREDGGMAPAARSEPREPEAREARGPAPAPPGDAAARPQARPRAAAGGADAQLVVIGAGPGGYTAAFRAADLGLEVTLVERHRPLGGVCLNVGCIPSKALLHAARVIEETREMRERGLDFGEPRIDPRKLVAWKNEVVKQLTDGLATLAKQRNVRVVRGSAQFASPDELEIASPDGEKRRLSFEQCILAAGSEAAALPGLPQDPRIIDSTGALELRALPERMLVIGGGIIGLEMATVYDALGVKVSVVELTKTLIPGCDRDLVRPLEKRIRARYEAIMLGTKVTKIEAQPEGLVVTFEGDDAPAEPQRYGLVLVAVGRRPNGKAVGAERAGLALDERGFVRVDKQMRTSVPHIFAIGDIAGPPMLAHKATHEGKVAAEAAAGEKSHFDARVVPSVAYTDPEVAWVGLTEEEAKAKGLDYRKGTFPWSASGRNLGLGRSDGLTKLLFDAGTGRLLGAGIVGVNAGDLIAEAALAIEMDCDAEDIGLTVHPHPTLSETIAFAAEAAAGTITDLYVPRRR
ncbi:MAG TPA: dihydrolipoyl dehydrogenase [Gammaproteobacteria bacterium]